MKLGHKEWVGLKEKLDRKVLPGCRVLPVRRARKVLKVGPVHKVLLDLRDSPVRLGRQGRPA